MSLCIASSGLRSKPAWINSGQAAKGGCACGCPPALRSLQPQRSTPAPRGSPWLHNSSCDILSMSDLSGRTRNLSMGNTAAVMAAHASGLEPCGLWGPGLGQPGLQLAWCISGRHLGFEPLRERNAEPWTFHGEGISYGLSACCPSVTAWLHLVRSVWGGGGRPVKGSVAMVNR